MDKWMTDYNMGIFTALGIMCFIFVVVIIINPAGICFGLLGAN